MNNQELFDKVAKHLLTQKAKSFDSQRERCMYRGPGGLCCAIGCLIPNEKYEPWLEGKGTTNIDVIAAAGLTEGNRELAYRLQLIHDNNEPEEWSERLTELAAVFKLEFNKTELLR